MIIWYEGWEHYGSDIANIAKGIWANANGSIDSLIKRTGARSLKMNVTDAVHRSLHGARTVCGHAIGVYMDALPNHVGQFAITQFQDVDGTPICSIQVSINGNIRIYKGDVATKGGPASVLLEESEKEMAPGTFNHIETKKTGTTVEVRVNGKSWVTATDVFADAGIIKVGHCDGSTTHLTFVGHWHVDDLVAWDDTDNGTGEHIDWLGQYGVYYLDPISDDPTQDWIVTVGTDRFAAIDGSDPDGDTDYIFSNASSQKSSFTCRALPSTVIDVAAVAPVAFMRKTDSGDCDIKLGIDSDGTEVLGADNPIMPDFTFFMSEIYEQDPHTVDVWGPTNMPSVVVERVL